MLNSDSLPAAAPSKDDVFAYESEGAQFKRTLAANLLSDSENNGSCEMSIKASISAAMDADIAGARVLAFKNKAPTPAEGHINSLKVLYSQNKSNANSARQKSYRHVPSAPERVLDAPELVDDYYINVLDWANDNTVAIALGATVFLWNATSGATTELLQLQTPDDYVTSLRWIREGTGHLAVGTASSEVQLWDVAASRQLRSMRGHSSRVGALSWNQHILTSGARDGSIFHHDVRIRDHHVATLVHHTQEVCGLSWSPDGTMLASGGNDNLVCIWDHMNAVTSESIQKPRHVLTEHQAAVKAVAWCPWQKGVLATGGGTADRSIKVWNAMAGTLAASVDTGSQVSAISWNPRERELLSGHGYAQNQLTLWRFPTLTKIKDLSGHSGRVLHMALSPDGASVCSAGADETLRFWKVFGDPPKKEQSSSTGTAFARGMHGDKAMNVCPIRGTAVMGMHTMAFR